jgi:hypothetical protein
MVSKVNVSVEIRPKSVQQFGNAVRYQISAQQISTPVGAFAAARSLTATGNAVANVN